jgi:hypothetical protein
MQKYRAKKTEVDGIVFDSKLEAHRYHELKLLEKAGEIFDLRRQVKFELLPSQRLDNKVVERPVYYVADFVYLENGKQIVEDTKGVKTRDYVIKRKLMLYVHHIKIKEVRRK